MIDETHNRARSKRLRIDTRLEKAHPGQDAALPRGHNAHCWNAGNELLQLKNSTGGRPNAGHPPYESPRGPFASPQQSAAPKARSLDARREFSRVADNRDTLT